MFLQLEILRYQASQLWVLLPSINREINTITLKIHFKNAETDWNCNKCVCAKMLFGIWISPNTYIATGFL